MESDRQETTCRHIRAKLFSRAFGALALVVQAYLIYAALDRIPCAVAQNRVGYVLEVRGSWILNNGGADLSPGAALPARGAVKIKQGYAPKSGDRIVIVDHQGRIIFKKQCDAAGECDKPINLPPAAANSESTLARILRAAMDVWGREPKKFTSFISRGGNLEEAVARLEGGRIDLSRVFARMPHGDYLLKFEPRSDGVKAAAVQKSFAWRGGNSALVEADGIEPGLYEVLQLDLRDKQPLEPGTEAWVLAAGPADYSKSAAAYSDAEPLIARWSGQAGAVDPQVSASAVRSFRRAYLASLAQVAGKN